MALLKIFDENGQEIGSKDVPLDESNFPQAIEQYGTDWGNGYNAAFADIMRQITGMMTRTDEFGEWSVSRQVLGRKVEEFHEQKSLTLEKITQLLSDSKLNP